MSRSMTTRDGQPMFTWVCDAITCDITTDGPLMDGWVSVITRHGGDSPPKVRDYHSSACMLFDYAWTAAAAIYHQLEVPALPPPSGVSPITYLIWSNQYDMWWGPDRRGYTSDVDGAGRYTQADARDIVTKSAHAGRLSAACVMVAAPDNWQLPPVEHEDQADAGEVPA